MNARGFTLIELLVALAIFAVAGVLAYSGLSQISLTRQRLEAEQGRFHEVQRSVELLARDLGEVADRPVRGAQGEVHAALQGDDRHLDLTRYSYAESPAQAHAALERVGYRLRTHTLERDRYGVLDRGPTSSPHTRDLAADVDDLTFRYLDDRGDWQLRWPPQGITDPLTLPRAVEFRIRFGDLGDVRRLVELVGTVGPAVAASSASP